MPTNEPRSSLDDDRANASSGGSTTSVGPTLPLAGEDPDAPLPPLPPGTVVHRYVLGKCMGAGGMGVVYEALDPQLDRKVALKLLTLGRKTRSDEVKERMLREAHALAQLSHPNVITVFDCGTANDDVYITMELVEGQTLAHWQHGERRRLADILSLYVAAGEGLAAAHTAGLVHRDFKPHNVLLGRDGRVRVIDFGLARSAEASSPEGTASESGHGEGVAQLSAEADSTPSLDSMRQSAAATSVLSDNLTKAGVIMGTPRYMSPEQHYGRRAGALSDQYSFCASLYEAVAGVAPFAGASSHAVRKEIERGALQAPAKGRTVPRWLRRVLLRGLSMRPEQRFDDMAALLRQLRRDRRVAWISAAAAVAFVATIAATAAFTAGPDAEARCTSGSQRIERIASAATRARLLEGFRKHAPSSAELVDTAIHGTLVTFERGYKDSYRAACQATFAAGAQSEALLDLRMACLARRESQMHELLNHLATVEDGDVIRKSPAVVAQLSDVSECDDTTRLRQRTPLPRAPQDRAKVEALQHRLDRAEALHLAGDYRAAHALATEVGRDGAGLDYAPLLAEAHLRVGESAGALSEADAALAALEEAGRQAALASDTKMVVRTLVAMTAVLTAGKSDHARADALLKAVTMLIAPLHDTALRARVLSAKGAVAFLRGDLRGARDAMLEAVGLLRADTKDEVELAAALTTAAPILTQLSETENVLPMLLEARGIIERRFGRQHPQMTAVLGNLASFYADKDELAKTAEYDEEALAIAESVLGPWHQRTGIAVANLGTTRRDLRDWPQAETLFRRAFEIFRQTLGPDHIMVNACRVNMGTVAYLQGDYVLAAERYAEALRELERTNNSETQWASDAMHPLALSYIKLGRHHEAEPLLNRVLLLRKKIYGEDHTSVANVLSAFARLSLAEGKTSLARRYAQEALDMGRRVGGHASDTAVLPLFLLARATWHEDPTTALLRVDEALALLGDSKDATSTNLRAEIAAWKQHPAESR